jgi:hypothetical protein
MGKTRVITQLRWERFSTSVRAMTINGCRIFSTVLLGLGHHRVANPLPGYRSMSSQRYDIICAAIVCNGLPSTLVNQIFILSIPKYSYFRILFRSELPVLQQWHYQWGQRVLEFFINTSI